MKSGIIVLDKPAGKSSAFISRIIGKMLGAKKVGHTGTLDPFATGVLPIAINNATKIIQYIRPKKKTYRFEIAFGEKRDTGDITGQVIDSSTNIPTLNDLENILPEFIGDSEQTPPSFSAIKINGQPAYKIAREGKIPNITKRKITIYSIKLIDEFLIEASVSPGTYIRALAEDIAISLGSIGYVKTLMRTVDGIFKLENSITMDFLEKKNYNLEDVLCNIEDVLDDIPVILIDEHNTICLLEGKAIAVAETYSDCKEVSIVSPISGFLAIARVKNYMAYPKRIVRKNFYE